MAQLKIGDILPAALWYNPWQPQDYDRAKEGITETLGLVAENDGVTISPVTFEVLEWNDDRLPEPPKWAHNGVKCLLGEAVITGYVSDIKVTSFLADLDKKDLERLRDIQRRVHRKYYPGEVLTDAQCDSLIEQIGPEAAFDAVKRAVDSGSVH